MQFKNGYLGAFLVTIAVVLTIAGSYIMSLDMEEQTVTKYRDSADLTGLFDAEEAPSYMPFNPSANQTGYYTDRTTKYFDGVDASTTTQPNKFQLNLEPISSTSGNDYDLSNVTPQNDYHLRVWYWTDNETRKQVSSVNMVPLTSLVTTMVLDSYTTVTITNATAPDYTASESIITFTTTNKISGGSILQPKVLYLKNPSLTGDLDVSLGATHPAAETDDPILAVHWDKRNNYAALYYDVAMTKPAGVASPADIWLLWDGNGVIGNWIFADAIDYSANLFPDNLYMVVADGVKLEGSS